MTHRQFITWRYWIEIDWNTPSRSDHYVMQVGQKVERVLHRKPKSVTLDGQKIRFAARGGKVANDSDKRAAVTALAKAQWLGLMTKPVREV